MRECCEDEGQLIEKKKKKFLLTWLQDRCDCNVPLSQTGCRLMRLEISLFLLRIYPYAGKNPDEVSSKEHILAKASK